MKKYKTIIICAAALASLSLLSLTACGSEDTPVSSSPESSITSETSASLGIYVQDMDNDGVPDKVVDRYGADLGHLYTLKEDGIYEGESLLLPMAQTESYTPATESEAAPTNETASSEATNETNTHTGGNTTAANTAAGGQTTANTARPSGSTGTVQQAQPQAPAQQQQTPAQPQPTVHAPIYEEKYVVDQAAWTEEVPIWGNKEIEVCNTCKADITGDAANHIMAHAVAGEGGSWHSEVIRVQTGTRTVYHEEKGHNEQVLICGGCTGTH